MSKFLTKFSGTVRARQTQQALEYLNERRKQGAELSPAKFQEDFLELMSNLTEKEIVPSLNVYKSGVFSNVSSEIHNDMIDKTSNDLIASFEELDKIEQVHMGHQRLVQQNLLANFRSALSELQTKVKLYEFLNANQYGFEKVKYSTFKETQEERTNRTEDSANFLFTDPKTNKYLSVNLDAHVDIVGDRLVLGVVNNKEVSIEDIEQTFGSTFPPSNANYDGDDIRNIIDQQNGTFWIKSMVKSEEEVDGLNVQLKLELPGIKEINYIEIESAVLRAIKLSQVSYLNKYNETVSFEVNEEISGIKKIMFSKIAANALYLDFNIPDYLRYETQGEDYSNQTVLSDLVTPAVKEAILASPGISSSPEVGVRYQIGFDNIRVGLSRHTTKSIYLSQPLEVSPFEETLEEESTKLSAIVGLKAIATRPYLSNQGIKFTNLLEEENTNYLGSIEYWVVKKDIQGGNTIRTKAFPILPMGTQKVKRERLLFTEDVDDGSSKKINNSGRLCFIPESVEDIHVYRNGLLFEGTWNIDSNNTRSSPNLGFPMVTYIKIDKESMELGDIFTVDYFPKTSDSYSVQYLDNQSVVDLTGDTSIRTVQEQLVFIDENSDVNIEKYKLYLMVILRQNTAEREITPAVEEYTFALGAKDLLKFEE